MTVSSEINKSGPYTGNGVTTVFAYGFRILDASHIEIIRTEGGIDTTVSPSAYSVSGVGSASGNVVFSVAPASGQSITIIRNVPFTQSTDLENQGAYYAETIEQSLDLAAMRDQQLAEELSRAVKVPVGRAPLDTDEAVEGLLRFSDIYQGASDEDLSVRVDGSALEGGDLYYNNLVGEYRFWNGSRWVPFSTIALHARFYGSLAEFDAATIPNEVNLVFIKTASSEVVGYRREPGAAGAEDLPHRDGSKWAKATLTKADLNAALTEALSALETYPDAAGTFAPTLTFATPGTLDVTYVGIQRGWYQRIGDMVFATVNLNTATISKGTATGNLRLAFDDLPFTPSANSMGTGVIRAKNARLVPPDGARIISLHVVPGQKYLEFAYMGSAGGVNYLNNTHVTDGAMVLQLTFQFEVV